MHAHRSDHLNKGRCNFHKLVRLIIILLGKEGLPFAPQGIILPFQGVCMVTIKVLETQNF